MNIGKKIITLDNTKIPNRKMKFYGHRYFINGKFITETQCRICGHKFSYEGLKKPPHCGKSGCEEWWRQHIQHQFFKADLVRDKKFFLQSSAVRNIVNQSHNIRTAEDKMREHRIIPEQMLKRIDRKRMVFASFQLKGKKAGEI